MKDDSLSTDPKNKFLAKAKKSKFAKDEEEPEPLQPKKVITAFLYFNGEFSSEIRAKNPSVVIPMGEVSKLVGEKWGAMTEAQKKPYENKNAADKRRYE